MFFGITHLSVTFQDIINEILRDIINKRKVVDTSNFTMGGVLSVKCEDGKWRPVAYISKLLNEMERNYEIHNKEMLAVIHCLEA